MFNEFQTLKHGVRTFLWSNLCLPFLAVLHISVELQRNKITWESRARCVCSFASKNPPLYLTSSHVSPTEAQRMHTLCASDGCAQTCTDRITFFAWLIPISRLLCKFRPSTYWNCVPSYLSTPSNFHLLGGAYTFIPYVVIPATSSFTLKLSIKWCINFIFRTSILRILLTVKTNTLPKYIVPISMPRVNIFY